MWPRPGVSKQWVGSYVQAEYLAYSHTHSEYQKSEKQTHFMIRLTLEVGPTLTLCTRPITDSLQHNQSLTPPVLSLTPPCPYPYPPPQTVVRQVSVRLSEFVGPWGLLYGLLGQLVRFQTFQTAVTDCRPRATNTEPRRLPDAAI